MVNLDASRAVAECRPVSSALPSHTLALADEIERLRGMLVANDLDPDCEYIAKGGLRVNAPASNFEPKF